MITMDYTTQILGTGVNDIERLNVGCNSFYSDLQSVQEMLNRDGFISESNFLSELVCFAEKWKNLEKEIEKNPNDKENRNKYSVFLEALSLEEGVLEKISVLKDLMTLSIN